MGAEIREETEVGGGQRAQTISASSGGAIHMAVPSQKPKSFFLSAVGSATNGRPLVALTTHSNIPGNLRFSLPERQIFLVLAAQGAC